MALMALRDQAPLVQCITNFVAMNFAANVVLAAGAAPAMIHTAEESGDFAAVAAGLSINIGTLSPPWVDGMRAAIAAAKAANKPWVFDPVGHFATPYRAGVARGLLAQAPTVLRANASEVLALDDQASSGRGVDAADEVASAEASARALARRTGGVVAVTGAVDFVTDGSRAVRIAGGHPLMPKVTATGCALSCLVSAYTAAVADPFDATAAALVHFASAGARAGAEAKGPGSFAAAFLDALHLTTPGHMDRVEVTAA
ncbi:MAG: hydroxyethylthiazole kinase [Rhodobacteraceae bacterium]|nr:hydroxyethylthiazole kinase [Paracoccaceae bacterium]